MRRLREHINRLQILHAIVTLQIVDVLRKRRRITRHIHKSLRFDFLDGVEEFAVAADPWRVDDDDVGAPAFLFPFGHEVFGAADVVVGVVDAGCFGVLFGVVDSFFDDVHSPDFFGSVCEPEADGADAAVSVDDFFVAGEGGGFLGFSVELARLERVELEEGAGREFVGELVQAFFNAVLTLKVDRLITEDQGRLLRIDVLDDGDDFRQALADFLDEEILLRDLLFRSNKYDLDLSRFESYACDNRLDDLAFLLFVINGDLEIIDDADDFRCDLVRQRMLDDTFVDVDELVGIQAVEAGDGFAVLCADLELAFVPVVPRIIHSDCRADIELIEIELRVALEGLDQDIAFGVQLSLILKMLKLASTALFIDWAWGFRSLG